MNDGFIVIYMYEGGEYEATSFPSEKLKGCELIDCTSYGDYFCGMKRYLVVKITKE